jgi:tRNA(fMet)-specific endonuclease VapC
VSGYLLDTNIASHVIRGDRPEILSRLVALPMESIAISAVSEGELLYGVAKRGHPPALSERVRQFLIRVDILPWDGDAAGVYGDLRAACETSGVSLSPLDMMIAAHALALTAALVTRDKAFSRLTKDLRTEDWSVPTP